jgi:lysophospholipase L1-like esterase
VTPTLLASLLALAQSGGFELRDGDRVALIGNTFIERDLPHNALESRLTARFKDRGVTFRNLGWSGDTVWGDARAGFGRAQDGFNHLTKHVAELRPTVIFLAYGMNESFEGEKGLPRFLEGLGRLLDMLEASRARIVMLSPVRHEDLGRPLPDPSAHNRDLRRYIEAMAKVAAKRGHDFIDLYELVGAGTPEEPLTENGIHLNARGYRKAALAIEKALGLAAPVWRVELDSLGQAKSEGTALSGIQASTTSIRFAALDQALPLDPGRILKFTSLNGGLYTLTIDGQKILSGTESQWKEGLPVTKGPAHQQAAKLRETIAAKNAQYFNRWRPQNETYIFGFRKKEQGHLAPEIPQFDPIIEKMEGEIATLRLPVEHTFVLEREK